MQVLHFPLGNVRWCCHHGTQSAVSSKSYTQNCHLTRQFHSQAYAPKTYVTTKKAQPVFTAVFSLSKMETPKCLPTDDWVS